MPSRLAIRIMGEAEEVPPSRSSVASEWFKELGGEAQSILVDGNVDNIEIQATALLVPDRPHQAGDDYGTWEEHGERVATWEEAQNPAVEGNWQTVDEPGQPITAFSIYAHRRDSGAHHIEDFKTHEEAETKASALSALLGVGVSDFSPLTEAYSKKFIRDLVKKSLKPYVYIKLLDGAKEELFIPVEWTKDVYTTGSAWHPGLTMNPTDEQLEIIGGPIGGLAGGRYAMEVIHYNRYEGPDTSGTLHDDPEEQQRTAEEIPDMYFRPLYFEYRNEGEAPEELYT